MYLLGISRRSDVDTVSVQVVDINDECPVFTHNDGIGGIIRYSQEGSEIVAGNDITLSDSDSDIVGATIRMLSDDDPVSITRRYNYS